MKKKIILLASILLLLLFLAMFMFLYNYGFNINVNNKKEVKLFKCVDGDTIWFSIDNKNLKYRMLGIDTPESDEEFGNISSNYTCDTLKSAKKIEIEYDNVGYKKDKYNRELVWVFVDGELLQNKILELGLARVKYIYANYIYLEELYKYEESAINDKVGIWEDYELITYNDYYNITFDYLYKNKNVDILKNSHVGLIDNPYKLGCRFIGWKNGNYLFDLSKKINKNYKLKPSFDC